MVLIVLYDGKLPVEYLDVFEEDGIDEVKIEGIYGLFFVVFVVFWCFFLLFFYEMN
jgi:hypothetical protein